MRYALGTWRPSPTPAAAGSTAAAPTPSPPSPAAQSRIGRAKRAILELHEAGLARYDADSRGKAAAACRGIPRQPESKKFKLSLVGSPWRAGSAQGSLDFSEQAAVVSACRGLTSRMSRRSSTLTAASRRTPRIRASLSRRSIWAPPADVTPAYPCNPRESYSLPIWKPRPGARCATGLPRGVLRWA